MTIRRVREEFAVEEVLAEPVRAAIAPAPAGFALYRLAKEGLTTPDACTALARKLGLPPSGVEYAGMKDKHARTVQHVTVQAAGVTLPETAAGQNWTAQRLGWLDRPVAAADIAANHFEIIVRDLSQEACHDMDEAAALLTVPVDLGATPKRRLPGDVSDLLIVDYFGDQRFGSARHGKGFLARHLIRGRFEEALRLAIATPARKDSRNQKEFKRAVAEGWGKWAELAKSLPRYPERRAIEALAATAGDFRAAFAALPHFFQFLCVEAYQSHLWTATARLLIAQRCAEAGPILEAADPFGKMLFPASAAVPEDLRGLVLPVLGHDSPLEEPWKSAAEAVLTNEGLTTADLSIPGLRRPSFGAAPRPLFVTAEGFVAAPAEHDEITGGRRFKRALQFNLPRGAYATVLLRALGQ